MRHFPYIAFDQNGTVLNLAPLDPLFTAVFGAASWRRVWFELLIQSAMTSTLTGEFAPFAELAKAALHATAARHGVTVDKQRETEILDTMRLLPAFDDVRPALTKLKAAGFKLAVVTNSGLSSSEESLAHAGIRDLFDVVWSVEAARKYKPAPDVYRHAAVRLHVEPSGMLLVAAHDWDTTGALRAGCRAAFVARPEEVLSPAWPKPEIVGRDMHEVVEQVLATCA